MTRFSGDRRETYGGERQLGRVVHINALLKSLPILFSSSKTDFNSAFFNGSGGDFLRAFSLILTDVSYFLMSFIFLKV